MMGKRKGMKGCLAFMAGLAVLAAGCAWRPADVPADGRPADSEPARTRITIFANLHTAEVPDKRIEELVEARTNTELEIQWIPDGNYDEKVNAAIVADALPHALFLKNAASLAWFKNEMRNGLFWEIGSRLHRYPNLSRLKPEVLRNLSVDGEIYGLYQERPLSRQGVIFRKDWADRLGLSAPASIEDLYEMLRRFTHDDPDGNGLDDTIGLADRGDLIYGAFKTVASYHGAPNGWGEKDGRLLPEFMFEEYMDTLRFFRKLHEQGLINREFPVTGKIDQQALLIGGKAGVYIGAMGDVITLQAKLQEANPDAVLDVSNRIAGPYGNRVWASEGYGTVVLFPKSSNRTEEELDAVLSFFDQLMSAELANLLYWGIEGRHYELRDGMAVPSQDIKLTTKEVKPYMALVVGGRETIPGLLKPEFESAVKEKADRLIVDNNHFLVHDPTAPLESATRNERGERLRRIVDDATWQFILGTIDEAGFWRAVDQWRQEGGDQIIREINEAYRRSMNG
jgi:ABC-type sugar transport system, periplasmic component